MFVDDLKEGHYYKSLKTGNIYHVTKISDYTIYGMVLNSTKLYISKKEHIFFTTYLCNSEFKELNKEEALAYAP
jgi:hypothetical protein